MKSERLLQCAGGRSLLVCAVLLALFALAPAGSSAAPAAGVVWVEAESTEKPLAGAVDPIDEQTSDFGSMAKSDASGARFVRFGPGARLAYPPVRVPTAGERAVWVRSFIMPGRYVTLAVDGKDAGTTEGDLGVALNWQRVGTLRLAAGEHRLEVRAAEGNTGLAYVDAVAFLTDLDAMPTGRSPEDIIAGGARTAHLKETFSGDNLADLSKRWSIRPPGGADAVVRMLPKEDDGVLHVHNGSGERFTLTSRLPLDVKPGDQVTLRVRMRKGTLCEYLRVTIPGVGTLAPQLYKQYKTSEETWIVPAGVRGPLLVQVTGGGGGDTYLSHVEAFRPDPPLSPFVTGRFLPPPSLEREGRLFEIERFVVNADAFTDADEDGDRRWSFCRLSREENTPSFFSRGTVLKSDCVTADRATPEAGCPPLHVRVGPIEPGRYQAYLAVPGRALAYSPDGKEWTRLPSGRRAELGVVEIKEPHFEFWLDDRYAEPGNPGPTYVDFIRFLPLEDPTYTMAPAPAPKPLARGSVQRRQVALTVENPTGHAREGEPIRSGVPIPKGELADAEHARVLDDAGRELPACVQVTGRWPDGSIKWLLLDLQATVGARASRRYTLEYGNAVRRAPVPAGVKVESRDGRTVVDTGALRAVFDAGRGGALSLTRSGGSPPNVGGDGGGRRAVTLSDAEFRAADGRVWRSALDGKAQVEVEEQNALHAAVRVRGRATDEKGAGPLAYDVRVHFYAGRPEALVEYAFFATEAEPTIPLSGVALRFGDVEATSARFGLADGESAPLPCRGGLRLLQTGKDAYGSGGPFPFALRDGAGKALAEGERASGWMRLDTPSGPALLCVPWFWQQFPKALSCDEAGVTVELWPSGEGVAPFTAHAGAGKSHRIGISLDAKASPERWLSPLFARAEPEWYCASGAFEGMVPRRAGRYEEYEAIVDASFELMLKERVGYGMENWGDGWQGGYVPGAKTWSNQEWDLVNNWVIPFVRTGDRRFLDYAHEAARHYADVDCIHFSRNEALIGAAWMHAHTSLVGHQLEPPNFAHAGWVEGMLSIYHLTGDRRGLEASRGIADYITRHAPRADTLPPGGPPYNLHIQRPAGWPLTTLCLVYRETWDPVLLQTARRIADYARRCREPERGAWDAQTGHEAPYRGGCVFAYTLLRGLRLFSETTGEARARDDYAKATRWILTELWRPGHRYLYEQCPLHEPGTLVPFTLSEMGGYASRVSGDPLPAAIAFDALQMHAAAGAKSWMVDSAPRSQWGNGILQQVPRMIHDWERLGLAADPRLTLAASARRVRVPQGRPGSVALLLRNDGDRPIEGLTASCLVRGDWSARVEKCPSRVAPGESAEILLSCQAPPPLARYLLENDLAHVHVLAKGRMGGADVSVLGHARLEIAGDLEVEAPAAAALKPGSTARLRLGIADGFEPRPQVAVQAQTEVPGVTIGLTETVPAGDGAVSVVLPLAAEAGARAGKGVVAVEMTSGSRKTRVEVPVEVGKTRAVIIESDGGEEWRYPFDVLRAYPDIAVEFLPAGRVRDLFPATAKDVAARWEVVILGDTGNGAEAFAPEQLAALAAFVRDGGGLMTIGGAKCYTPGGYAPTPLAGLLPVGLSDGAYVMGEIGVEVLEKDAVFFEGYEPLFPPFGAHQKLQAKPGARVIARFTDGTPFAALGEAGKGRVLALGAIWNHGSGRAFREWPNYGRFIGRCVRWAGGDL